jgi:hypothetical protein
MSGCNQIAIKWLVLHPLMQFVSPLCRQPNRSSDRVNAYDGPRDEMVRAVADPEINEKGG